MAKQGRLERRRARFPATTGIYRVPSPGEPARGMSIGHMLENLQRLAHATLEDAESSEQAERNAREGLQVGERFLELWHNPPSQQPEAEVRAWAGKLSIYAAMVGMFVERLIVRMVEDDALKGKALAQAQSKGGTAVGGAKHEAAILWREEAQQEAAQVWARRPALSKSAVTDSIAGKFGKSSNTIRQVIRKPTKT